MKIIDFDPNWFAQCRTLRETKSKHSSGQITILGGSKLFHGAPLMALRSASRIVSMVYFSTPDEDKDVATQIKAGLSNFIWVPYEEVESYIAKSDSVLIGPGMMRSHVKEQGYVLDGEGEKTRAISEMLFKKFPDKKWVVDGGSLQVVQVGNLPKGSVVSPNRKEFEILFGEKMIEDPHQRSMQVEGLALKYGLVILTKDETSIVSDGVITIKIKGGNDGLVKGGMGDVIAGVTVGFLAKDEAVYAVAAASYLVKKAAEKLAETNSLMFNSDDLANTVPLVYGEILNNL